MSAELCYDPPAGTLTVYRLRMLELTDTQVITDAPRDGGDAVVPPDEQVTVHFLLHGGRYRFDTVIESYDVRVRLNARETLRGIALRKPLKVASSQRRADFRKSLAAFEAVEVSIVPRHPDFTDACRPDALRISAKIVQISAGGVGLLVEHGEILRIPVETPCFLSFTLPDVEPEFVMLAIQRHKQTLHDGKAFRIGWQFQEWGAGPLKQDRRRLARFIADSQRKQLKRRG